MSRATTAVIVAILALTWASTNAEARSPSSIARTTNRLKAGVGSLLRRIRSVPGALRRLPGARAWKRSGAKKFFDLRSSTFISVGGPMGSGPINFVIEDRHGHAMWLSRHISRDSQDNSGERLSFRVNAQHKDERYDLEKPGPDRSFALTRSTAPWALHVIERALDNPNSSGSVYDAKRFFVEPLQRLAGHREGP